MTRPENCAPTAMHREMVGLRALPVGQCESLAPIDTDDDIGEHLILSPLACAVRLYRTQPIASKFLRPRTTMTSNERQSSSSASREPIVLSSHATNRYRLTPSVR